MGTDSFKRRRGREQESPFERVFSPPRIVGVREHSSLTRIRDRLGEEVFEAVFRRIVGQCQEKGLVKKVCRVMTDATLIAADASLDSLVHVDPEQAKNETHAQQRCGAFDGRSPRMLSNQTHRSCTDPEATLAQKKGTPRQLKYKVHQTIDADSRVILDTEVTTGARHDNQPYLAQLERVRACYQITIGEATADRGYGSADIIRALEGQQATTYIPLWSGRVGTSKYLKGELVYEKEHDRFRCPAGKYLIPNPTVTENHKRYVSSSEDCRNCPQASTCPAKRCRTEYIAPASGEEESRPRPIRGGTGIHARIDVPRTSVRADVEVRGVVRRVQAIPLPRARQVPRAFQSADPGLSQCDCAEPQAPALPTLWLAVSCAAGLVRPTPCLHCHLTNRAHQPTAKPKTYSHFFNTPRHISARLVLAPFRDGIYSAIGSRGTAS